MKDVDCLIIGQGIAGTLLSFELMQAGLSIQVIDSANPAGASRIASGVINPVTGRRVVETWKIKELLPLAATTYNRISQFLEIPPVARTVDVLAVHNSNQMEQAYVKRSTEGSGYIRQMTSMENYRSFFKLPYGLHTITPTLLIDLQTLLTRYSACLLQKQLLLTAPFDWNALVLSGQREQPVYYRSGDIQLRAKWVIAAEGAGAVNNPYFKELPFRFNKGEALIISIPDLPRSHIYKLRYSIVPWGDQDLFWVGSTYQWEFEDALPTSAFKAAVIEFLNEELLIPYQIVDHIASLRPASINRRPFAGLHWQYPQLGILNGLGTKGCSLAPYLAVAWKDKLIFGKEFDPDVALDRER